MRMRMKTTTTVLTSGILLLVLLSGGSRGADALYVDTGKVQEEKGAVPVRMVMPQPSSSDGELRFGSSAESGAEPPRVKTETFVPSQQEVDALKAPREKLNLADLQGKRNNAGFADAGPSTGLRDSECSYSLSDSQGTITSPNHPSQYSANADCRWTIQWTSGQSTNFLFDFDAFDTEFDYDRVEIGHNGNTVVFSHSGPKNPGKRVIGGVTGPIWIRFRSDATVERTGFTVHYQTTNQAATPAEYINEQEYDITYYSSPSSEYPSGSFLSHAGNGNYANNLDLFWFFSNEPYSVTVFTLVRLQSEEFYDTLSIFYGFNFDPNVFRIAHFSGNRNNEVVIARYTSIGVEFKTDSSITGTGFQLRYTVYPSKKTVIDLTKSSDITYTDSGLNCNQRYEFNIDVGSSYDAILLEVDYVTLQPRLDHFVVVDGTIDTGRLYPISASMNTSKRYLIQRTRAAVQVFVGSHQTFRFSFTYDAVKLTNIVTPMYYYPPSDTSRGVGTISHAVTQTSAKPSTHIWRVYGMAGYNLKLAFDDFRLGSNDLLTVGLGSQVSSREVLRLTATSDEPLIYVLNDSVIWVKLKTYGGDSLSLRYVETQEWNTINYVTAVYSYVTVSSSYSPLTLTAGRSQILWLVKTNGLNKIEVKINSVDLQPNGADQLIIGSGNSVFADDRYVVKRLFSNTSPTSVTVTSSQAWVLLISDDAAKSRTWNVQVRGMN